ncbi:MAG TPA: HU family DNA-binding protein [Clostridiales bacterium]|nr:HU family DNA-binding protein [Clostridiales bacterium]
MNKQNFVKRLSTNTGASQAQSKEFLDIFLDTVTEVLAEGEDVNFVGFGKFSVAERAERKGRNPQDGSEIILPASKLPKFKAGKSLKDAVNES